MRAEIYYVWVLQVFYCTLGLGKYLTMKVTNVFLELFYIHTYLNRYSLRIFKNIELYFDIFTICRRCLLHFNKLRKIAKKAIYTFIHTKIILFLSKTCSSYIMFLYCTLLSLTVALPLFCVTRLLNVACYLSLLCALLKKNEW